MSRSNRVIIGGREAEVSSLGRVRRKVGWGYYNLVSVRFLDNGEYHSMGSAQYAKWAQQLERAAKVKETI